MTLRHVVAWRLATEDDRLRAEQAAEIVARLQALRSVIGGIESLSVGVDTIGGSNWDVALAVDFADREALAAYQDHPEHRAVAAYVVPLVAGRAAVDFEL